MVTLSLFDWRKKGVSVHRQQLGLDWLIFSLILFGGVRLHKAWRIF